MQAMPAKKKPLPRKPDKAKPQRKPAAPRGNGADSVYQLKVTLLDTHPAIWRRFALPAAATLETLHRVLQIVMGWQESHLHQFVTEDEQLYGPHFEDTDPDSCGDIRDERCAKLCEVAGSGKSRFIYEYDFGDGWQHGLEVEKIGPPQAGIRYPVCLAGERACPPEDCGGAPGYAEFLDAISDDEHPGHEEMLEWIGGDFDPDAFDLEAINRLLRKIK
jgi:hypothetical protein